MQKKQPTRWLPDTLDPILIDRHSRGCTDREITCQILDLGFPVAMEDTREARRRLGLKANVTQTKWQHDTPANDRPNPLNEAKLWLGKRLVEKPSGYWLDGRPVSLTTVMQALNAMRVQLGMPQFAANDEWRVKE